MKYTLTHAQVMQSAANIAHRLTPGARIYGIPRGGIPVAYAIAGMVPKAVVVDTPEEADVIVDDLVDSGATSMRFIKQFPNALFYALFNKKETSFVGKWVVFPWETTQEHDASADDIVTRLLQFIGEDPSREGLAETPKRFLKAWKEWAWGYEVDPKSILKTFEDGAEQCGDEFVIVHNIPVVSKCEHHLADIYGTAHVGYIPNGKIVGLSKLARLVEVYARRLQVQERLTNQIATALDTHLAPKGVGVIIRATHACMSGRGVRVHGAPTTTSALRGVCRTDPAARAEFMGLCSAAEASHG